MTANFRSKFPICGMRIMDILWGCMSIALRKPTYKQYTDAHRKTHFFGWQTLDDSKFWPVIERIHKSKCNTIALHSICLWLWVTSPSVCTRVYVYACMPVGVHVYCIAQHNINQYNTWRATENSLFWVTDSRWQQILDQNSLSVGWELEVSYGSGCLLHCAQTTK